MTRPRSCGRARSGSRSWSGLRPRRWASCACASARRAPGFDPRVGVGAIAAVLAIYAVTALVYDQPEGPATTLIVMLAVIVACWLAGGRPAIVCGLVAAVAGPLAEIVIVELDLAEYAPSADSLFGVALWLPALYFAFGFVAARLAELLVARR